MHFLCAAIFLNLKFQNWFLCSFWYRLLTFNQFEYQWVRLQMVKKALIQHLPNFVPKQRNTFSLIYFSVSFSLLLTFLPQRFRKYLNKYWISLDSLTSLTSDHPFNGICKCIDLSSANKKCSLFLHLSLFFFSPFDLSNFWKWRKF